MLKKSALLLAASATLLTGCWGSNGQQLSEDDVKRIVEDYIKNDTGKVLDAVNAYAMQQQEAARQKEPSPERERKNSEEPEGQFLRAHGLHPDDARERDVWSGEAGDRHRQEHGCDKEIAEHDGLDRGA